MAKETTRLTWRDFPAFVAEVNKLKLMKAKREEAKLALGDLTAGFGREFINRDRAALEAEIENRANAMLGGGTATMEAVKTRADLEKDLIAANRAVERQENKVRYAHVEVTAAIARHNEQGFRKAISAVRDDVLNFQRHLNELRTMRHDIAIDMGHGEGFSVEGAVGGGIAEPSLMCLPLSIAAFMNETALVHQIRGMVTQFANPVGEYLDSERK
jgi:hypothetical protein